MKRVLGFLLVGLVILGGLSLFSSPPSKKKKVSQDQAIHLVLTGNLLFEQGLYVWSDHYDFKDYFDQVKPCLQFDETIGNQEVSMGGRVSGMSEIAYTFNAP